VLHDWLLKRQVKQEPCTRLRGEWGGGHDLDHDGGGVVAAGFGDGAFDEGSSEVVERDVGAQHFFDAFVPEAVGEAVAANQEPVARLAADGADVWVDDLVART